MGKNITISDLENHFISRVDRGASIDNVISEFASMIKAKFIKFNYRNPDSYGVIIDKHMWINLFYSPQKDTFGFQCFNLDGELKSVLSLQHSSSGVVDLILRLANNMNKFTEEESEDSYYEDESYESDSC